MARVRPAPTSRSREGGETALLNPSDNEHSPEFALRDGGQVTRILGIGLAVVLGVGVLAAIVISYAQNHRPATTHTMTVRGLFQRPASHRLELTLPPPPLPPPPDPHPPPT